MRQFIFHSTVLCFYMIILKIGNKQFSHRKSFLLELGGEMKNKDRMQFNLKNWKRQFGYSDFWNRTDSKIVTFEKILNKDRNKKKQEELK